MIINNIIITFFSGLPGNPGIQGIQGPIGQTGEIGIKVNKINSQLKGSILTYKNNELFLKAPILPIS